MALVIHLPRPPREYRRRTYFRGLPAAATWEWAVDLGIVTDDEYLELPRDFTIETY